jgi:hypothetical protein
MLPELFMAELGISRPRKSDLEATRLFFDLPSVFDLLLLLLQ